MKSDHQKRIENFMLRGGQDVPAQITIPNEDTLKLRAMLILSEAMETIMALGVDISVYYPSYSQEVLPITKNNVRYHVNATRGVDLVGVADGCADVSVVTIGTLSAFGIHDVALLEEVDRTNLDKVRNGVLWDKHGKIQKPADWQPPRIQHILDLQDKGTDE